MRFPVNLLLLCILLLHGCGLKTDKAVLSFQHADDGTQAADIAANGKVSVVSSIDLGLLVWDLEYDQKIYQWGVGGEGANLISNVRIAFDSSYVVSSDRDSFALWNLQNGEPEGFWRIDESTIRDVAVADQGVGILVGRGNGTVLFFEPFSGRRLEFLGHQEKINSVDISPNGRYALTGSNDYVAYLWDTQSGQVIYRFDHPTRVTKVAIDPKGRYLFTADSQKAARIWDVQTGKEVSNLSFIQRQKIFTAVEFSDDGSKLLTGSPNRHLSMWDVATGELLESWRVKPNEHAIGKSAIVYAVGFYNEGQVISESSSGWAEVWDL
ncbi:MAG: WD40 repeat domain-containing protein [Aestuariibacter sp.]